MTTTHDSDESVDVEEPAPPLKLSWVRLGILVLSVALVAVGGVFLFDRVDLNRMPVERAWGIPYVDVTLTPTYEFQDPTVNPARDIALAFVVAHPEDPCVPSWGGAYTLDEASADLELDRRIRQLRAAGGDIMISFGGQANHELAFACQDEARLLAAYRQVIDRYDARVIDLDIENADLADGPSIERRARVIAALQEERELGVWVTLPVARSGLTGDGVEFVRSTVATGVELAGVNVMTMNFGDASNPTPDMFAATVSALNATVDQVGGIYASLGSDLDESQRWARVGATPMIGQNDVAGEVFTVDNAHALADFAVARGLGRVSMWSLNRDQPCGASFADVMVLSNTCSSVEQEPWEFANVFISLPGRDPSLPETEAVTVLDQQRAVDDPATSPFPIWRPDAQYPAGYKTVRKGIVYQAKWYNHGEDPATVVGDPWDSPWSLVGPVSPDDEPFTPPTVPTGTYPEWDPDEFYSTGDRVLLEGLPYEARWPNEKEVPSVLFPVGPDSAWRPLFTVPGEPESP